MKNLMSSLLFVGVCAFLFSGCEVMLGDKVETVRSEPSKITDPGLQSICDVARSRARNELLKRLKVDQFRTIALKISEQLSQDEIADLVRLSASSSSRGVSPEGVRARNELINEIYSGAMQRAELKPFTTSAIAETDLSYTVGVDSVTTGTDSYASIVSGQLPKSSVKEGEVSQISLSASPDQSRYYVELYELVRNETASDGALRPVYLTSSLFDAADELAPRYCAQVETALNLLEFNTVPGLTAETSSRRE